MDGSSSDATLEADPTDRRGRVALGRHHRGVALELRYGVERAPFEPAARHLVHECQEEDDREHHDRPEAERAERTASTAYGYRKMISMSNMMNSIATM